MATCESLQQIFENPLPENPPTLETLSFTDLIGEIHFQKNEVSTVRSYNSSESFYLMNSESLQLCTEGLGFESLDDLQHSKNVASNSFDRISSVQNESLRGRSTGYMGSQQCRKAKSCTRSFPPPISSLGRTGKRLVCFKSYRRDGRFVLQEVRVPTQEYLRASREGGRLRLSFVQPDDDGDGGILQREEDDEDEGEECGEGDS